MLSPPGGIAKSVGRRISRRSGSTITEAEASTTSVTVFMPTQTPA
jgi:hypothetical protein